MLLLAISAAVSIFLLAALILVLADRNTSPAARLMEVTAGHATHVAAAGAGEPRTLAQTVANFTRTVKPVRSFILATDEDLSYRLGLAGYRKSEHVELYVAAKMLLPIAAILAATFFATSNVLLIGLVVTATAYFTPDLVLTQLVARRREKIRLALPDALDLLVICMDAGLSMDQALVRVGEEMTGICPELSDEFLIIQREQRAGKPRLDCWRSMSERVDLEGIRQFVNMLVQTERFGTPVANALGQFADALRIRRLQAAEEMAAKTTIKLVFPLVLFIFPSMFVVLLGPAVIGISEAFKHVLK